MANFIHAREHLDSGDSVVVNCDTQCNVILLTDTDFSSYRSGQCFHYHGGHFKRFPVRLSAPSSGYWNVIIDLGGGSANIRYSINWIKA